MIARVRFFLSQALSALLRSLGITILAVVTIGLALAVLATFLVVVTNLNRVVEELGREVAIWAYLDPKASSDAAASAQATVQGFEGVESARYLSPVEAMAEFKAALGKDAVLLEGLPAEVLPPSLEIRPAARTWRSDEVRALSDRIGKVEGVEDVRYGQEDIERAEALLGFARIAALVLGVALSFATILIISNTIRLTVYARRDEIEIMSLVGATNTFVRVPFVLEGMIQGMLGGGLAAGTLIALERALKLGIERGLSYAYGPIQLDFVPLELLMPLVATGVLLGLIGSLLAVGKFLKV